MANNSKRKPRPRLGWHFLSADRLLRYGDGRRVEVGTELSIATGASPVLCSYGMHASPRIVDALRNHRGPVLCRVVVRGDIQTDRRMYPDKFCGRSRRVLWMRSVPKDVFVKALRAVECDRVYVLTGRRSNYVSVGSKRVTTAAAADQLSQETRNDSKKLRIAESVLKGWALSNGAVE